eukprot:12377171-Karenia_brevis.AAC.1
MSDVKSRLTTLESQDNSSSSISDLEPMRKKLLDDTDPAFLQIAFVGFKDIEIDKRTKLLQEFATQ